MKSGVTTNTGHDYKTTGILKDARVNPLSLAGRDALALTLGVTNTGILATDISTGAVYTWDGTMFVPVGALAARFGIEDILGVQNRAINMQTFNLVLTNGGVYELNTLSFTVACLQAANSSKFSAARNGLHNYALIQAVNDGITREITLQNDRLAVNNNSAFLQLFVESITADRYIPLSVNDIAADSAGNIDIPVGVSSVTGYNIDNTDPLNPVILPVEVDGTTITGDGTSGNPLVATGGGGAADRFGIEDILGVQDRYIDMQQFQFSIDLASLIRLTAQNVAGTIYSQIIFRNDGTMSIEGADSSSVFNLNFGGGNINFNYTDVGGATTNLDFPHALLPATYTLPISVSGNFADATGNIPIGQEEYADNAAAITAGKLVGFIYRTGDVLKICH